MRIWGARRIDAVGAMLLLLIAGLTLRVVVAAILLPASGFHTDINAFAAWAMRMADVGPGDFYAPGYFADYPPGYMYVLWVLGEISRALEPVIGGDAITGLIKIPGILADLGVAWVIFLIGSRFFGDQPPVKWLGSGTRIGVIGAALYLFNPGVVFNSAVWGQMDSVGALVILLGLYALGRGWTEAAGFAAVVALVIKFQFGWLIPIVAVVGIKRHLFGRSSDPALAARPDPVRVLSSLAVGVGSLVLLIWPFGMTVLPTGDPTTGLIDKFLAAANQYQGLSINAFNVWRNPWSGLGNTLVWGDDQGIAFALGGLSVTWAMLGVTLFAVAAVLALVAVARRDDMQGLLMSSLTMAVAFFALPTRVHERYLFPALALLAPLAGKAARWAVLYVTLSALFFLNIYWVYSADWAFASPPTMNPGVGGDAFARDPLLAATVFTDWGIYLVSFAIVIVLGWVMWLAFRREPRPAEAVSPDELAEEQEAEREAEEAVAAASAVRAARGRAALRWLRQDPVSDAERNPSRRLDRRDLWIFTVIVLVALVFRLWRLDLPRQMIFDEVWHARTAVDFLSDWRWGWKRDAYEWTHPMLGKYLIAAGMELANPNQVSGTADLDAPPVALTVAPQRAQSGWPSSVAFTSDGTRKIVATDLRSGERITDWDAPGLVASLAWDQDTRRLLAGMTDDGNIAAWDLTEFLKGNGERAPPVSTPGIDTGMTGVLQMVLPLDESVIVVRSADQVKIFERATGAEMANRDIAVDTVTYTTEVTGDSPVTARVIALDMARQTIMSLDATSLETTSTQRPESAPLGMLLTTGHGSNQLVWVPVGPLPADDEHPAVDGGMLILKGGTIIPDDTVPLPGPALSMGWDSVANLVFVAGPSQVWAIEPHGDNRSGYGVFDETPVDGTPGPMAFDISDTSQTDDHGTLVLATARGDAGALVSIDVSDNAYAWRLASALFGAALAGIVYLLTAMLFRQRRIAVLAGLFIAFDLMAFAMSRIAMNDMFAAVFIMAAYALFWPIYGGRWLRSAWWVLPMVGVMIGLAAASKWVGWYALYGLWFLVLLRSQLGRFVLIGATGFAAVAVGIGAPWPFTLVAFATLAIGLAIAWVKPVRLTTGELMALPATALVVGAIGLAFAVAWPTIEGAREPHSLIELAFSLLFRGLQAGWPAVVALGITAVLLLWRAIRSLWKRGSDARWFAPAEMTGFAWPWIFACLFIIPTAVYVATYIPWLALGHTFAIARRGARLRVVTR